MTSIDFRMSIKVNSIHVVVLSVLRLCGEYFYPDLPDKKGMLNQFK